MLSPVIVPPENDSESKVDVWLASPSVSVPPLMLTVRWASTLSAASVLPCRLTPKLELRDSSQLEQRPGLIELPGEIDDGPSQPIVERCEGPAEPVYAAPLSQRPIERFPEDRCTERTEEVYRFWLNGRLHGAANGNGLPAVTRS